MDIWIQIEFQSRGSPHAHALLWALLRHYNQDNNIMKDAEGNEMTFNRDQICELMTTQSSAEQEMVCDMVDRHIQCCLPIIPEGEPHEVTGYCRTDSPSGYESPFTSNANEEEKT